MPPPSVPLSASQVDITPSDGWHILVEGLTALTAVVSLVQGLAVWRDELVSANRKVLTGGVASIHA